MHSFIKPYKSLCSVNETFSAEELASQLIRDQQYFIEPKIDGMALFASRSGRDLRLESAEKLELSEKFPHLVNQLMKFPVEDFGLVGELVLRDGKGGYLPHEDIVGLSHKKEVCESDYIEFIIYDLVRVRGKDLTGGSLQSRRLILDAITPNDTLYSLIESDRVDGCNVDALGYFVRKLTTDEGVVVKNVASSYTREGSKHWLKLKWYYELDLVVLGKRLVKGSSITFNYEVGFQTREGQIVSCGKTMNTNVQAEAGDIISCKVERVKRYAPGKFGVYLARVECNRKDKNLPDNEVLLEKMANR